MENIERLRVRKRPDIWAGVNVLSVQAPLCRTCHVHTVLSDGTSCMAYAVPPIVRACAFKRAHLLGLLSYVSRSPSIAY